MYVESYLGTYMQVSASKWPLILSNLFINKLKLNKLGMCTYGMFTEKTLKDLEHTIMYIDPVSISTRYTHNFYSLIRFVPKVSVSKLSLKKNSSLRFM